VFDAWWAQPSKDASLFETCSSHCQLAACFVISHSCTQESYADSCIDSPPSPPPPLAASQHPTPPHPPPSFHLTRSSTHPNLISTDQGASLSPAVQIKVPHFPAGIAWHPSPSQTPGTVQLVTGSADKTARLFSGEGKQLGSLQVMYTLHSMVVDIKLQCCQVVCSKIACPEGNPLLHDLTDVLFCMDKQPCSSAIDCIKAHECRSVV